ncbi:hypothetical protein ACI65C_005786 [Semiaphis heraclei]
MWSIVHFKNDNSVYAVPSTWIKNDVCAWPKKNVKRLKRLIETRIPNKFNFDFLPARLLKGGISEDDNNKSSSEDIDDEFKDPLFSPPLENSKSKNIISFSKKLITTQLQKSPDYIKNSQLPALKRKLVFEHHSINDIAKYFDNEEEMEYIQTSSSPFKVTKNYNTLTPEKIFGMSTSNRDNVSNTNLNIAGMHFQHDNSAITPRQSSTADLTNKVLRVVLKTKYDVEMILEKIDQLEHNLSTVYQTNNNKTDNYIEENDFWEILPIKDENQLNEIENKLLNKTFRSSLMWKWKKEAVRKIKVFENVSNSDIEEPIKIYIAGATFRIKAKKKTNELTDDYNEAI